VKWAKIPPYTQRLRQKFFFNDWDNQLEFIRDDNGKVVKQIITVNGQTNEMGKIHSPGQAL
jgi:hypothetical protein